MCGNTSKADFYLWIGDLTKIRLSICNKCALRELGTKNGKKRLAMFLKTLLWQMRVLKII